LNKHASVSPLSHARATDLGMASLHVVGLAVVAALLGAQTGQAIGLSKKRRPALNMRQTVESEAGVMSQAATTDASGNSHVMSKQELAATAAQNPEVQELMDGKQAHIKKMQAAAGSAFRQMEQSQDRNPAKEQCFDDNRNTKINLKEIQERNDILKHVQPWKFTTKTIAAYQKEPEIKKVFYVNADDSQRQEFMEKQLKAVNIPYERFPATTHKELQGMKIKGDAPAACWDFSDQGMAQYLKESPIDNVFGTTAVYLSQAKLLKKIHDEDPHGTDLYLIMEDDAQLEGDWVKDLKHSVKLLPADWDVAKFVFWGGKRCQDKVPVPHSDWSEWYEARGPDSFKDVNMYAGNQAYVVRGSSIKYILETLKDLPVMDIDGCLGSSHHEKVSKIANSTKNVKINWGLHTYVRHEPLGSHLYFGNANSRLGGKKQWWDGQKKWGDGQSLDDKWEAHPQATWR